MIIRCVATILVFAVTAVGSEAEAGRRARCQRYVCRPPVCCIPAPNCCGSGPSLCEPFCGNCCGDLTAGGCSNYSAQASSLKSVQIPAVDAQGKPITINGTVDANNNLQ